MKIQEELQLKDLEAANDSSETELRSLERWDWDWEDIRMAVFEWEKDGSHGFLQQTDFGFRGYIFSQNTFKWVLGHKFHLQVAKYNFI